MTILFILLLSLGVFNLINFTKPKFNVFNDCYPKFVEVKASTENYRISHGTGTIIDDDLSILTNSHVVSYTKANEYFYIKKIKIRFT